MLPGLPHCQDDPTTHADWSPIQYFSLYIDNKVFKTRGVLLNTTPQLMKIFFGISVHMACRGYPRIRVPVISSKMARFFKLRSLLMIFDDLKTKKADILWRVRPLLDHVGHGCLSLSKSEKVCIDEQIIHRKPPSTDTS